MNKYLKKQIEEAVKKYTIEGDGYYFDSLSEFSIQKVKKGVYSVSGTVFGTVCSPMRDSGNYYEPPEWDEYEEYADVELLVYTHRYGYEADVELESIEYDKPWEHEPDYDDWGD